MDQQIMQAAQSDPSQAQMLFMQALRQAGLDPHQPAVKSLMPYVVTGRMPFSEMMGRLGR
jgi:hypothetical protein